MGGYVEETRELWRIGLRMDELGTERKEGCGELMGAEDGSGVRGRDIVDRAEARRSS